MAKLNVNPGDASYVLPKGEYEVMVTGAVQKDPKQGEFPYIEVAFVVTAGEFKDRTFKDRLSLSPKAKARLASFVVACGIVGPKDEGNFEIDTDDFNTKVLMVKGEPETFKGYEQFRVNRFEMHPETAKAIEAAANAQTSPPPATTPAAPTKPAPAAAAPAPAKTPVRKPV